MAPKKKDEVSPLQRRTQLSFKRAEKGERKERLKKAEKGDIMQSVNISTLARPFFFPSLFPDFHTGAKCCFRRRETRKTF